MTRRSVGALLVALLLGSPVALAASPPSAGGTRTGATATPNVGAPATPATTAPATADALLRRMLAAERTLKVVGTAQERVLLPGVAPAPEHDRFVLPVAVTPELLRDAFTLRLGSSSTVASRTTTALVLQGNGPLTPTWTFWLDDRTGARLAYRAVDAEGRLVAEGRFTRVTSIARRAAPRVLPSPTSTVQALRLERYMNPSSFPEGYVPVRIERTTVGAGAVPALRLTFWDGLDALVLLIYRQQPKLPASSSAHVASLQIGRFSASAVGPAPKAALLAWLTRLASGPLGRLDPARTFEAPTGP